MSFKKLTHFFIVMSLAVFCVFAFDIDRVDVHFGSDNNIRFEASGRAGNLILRAAPDGEQAYAEVNYQEGSGYISFDRLNQKLTWETSIGYTLNRLSSHITKKAPSAMVMIPRGAELDLDIEVTSMGHGSLRFDDLHIQRFDLDVQHGDLDVRFPTENQSIVREEAVFHLMSGDMEIYDLANLKAAKMRINGGIGELSVDFGDRLFKDCELKLDHDIGNMDISIPDGTLVYIKGTQRDMSDYGFQKSGKGWIVGRYHENSPKLTINMSGPIGNLVIHWTGPDTN